MKIEEARNFNWVFGTQALKPVKYKIKYKYVRYWLFFKKKQYYIESEFCKISGYENENQARAALKILEL